MSYNDFAPYFRDGLLCLPEKTAALLAEAGLDKELVQTAIKGLALDDNKAQIALISRKLEEILSNVEEDTQAFRALTSNEAQFMLTGKPPAQV